MSLAKFRTQASLAALAALMTPAIAGAQTASTLAPASAATASRDRDGNDYEAYVPLTTGWYRGRISLYLSTDASDRSVARATHTNYAPKLANAIASNPSSVDDIYQFTNFKQGNVLPSTPRPAGPENDDPAYTPLWQLSLVTWKPGVSPRVLRSEDAILDARDRGLVSIRKTNVVINCPVVYTPSGGLLYGVHILR